MYRVTLSEAQTRLMSLIAAALEGETVLIAQEDGRFVQLVPVEELQRHPQFGSARGLIMIADDFDAPLEDFTEYML